MKNYSFGINGLFRVSFFFSREYQHVEMPIVHISAMSTKITPSPTPGLSARAGCAVCRGLWLAVLSALLSGCAGQMPREALPEKPRTDKLAALVMPPKAIGLDPDGHDPESDVISTSGQQDLIPAALDDSDALPRHTVSRLSFANTPLQDVLQVVTAGAPVALSIVWDGPGSQISRSSVSMTHLAGDLTQVLDKLADSYGFYWRYKDGMLHITADRQYVAPVPPVADLFDSLPIMVKTLGGTDVFLDRSARMITFRAGSQSFAKIRNYLDMTRKNRSLIIYDTYIWEVVLNDTSKMGIDWGALPGSIPATAITAGPSSLLPGASGLLTAGLVNAASGGTGLALSFAGSRFSMNMLIDFLRSQGTINSLSQPKIQLLSGGKASLKDEIATTYVSRIGSASVSAGTVIPGSVETSQVKTGMTLEVTGDVSDGTIYSDIALRASDLMGMGTATVSGSTITLPKTSSREVRTHVRAKPGDTILLAGIQYDKLNGTINTGMGLMRANQADVMRSELIIVMRPRIKYFVPQTSEEKTATKPVIPPVVLVSAVVPVVAPVIAPMPAPAIPSPLPLAPTPAPDSAPISAPAPAPVQIPVSTEIEEETVEEIPAQPPVVATEPTSTPVTPVPATPLAGVYVQLGAFGNVSNAENFRQDVDQRLGWRKDSAQSLWVIAPAKDSRLHRVLVGPFASRQAAQAWAERGQRVVGTRPILVIF